MNYYCTQCGTMLQYPFLFCINCGTRNKDLPVYFQEYGFENQDREQVKLKRVKQYYIKASLITLLQFVMGLIAVGAVIFFFPGLDSSAGLIIMWLIIILLCIWWTALGFIMLLKMQKQHTMVKEDILSKKNSLDFEDESDKIIYDYAETLPYPDHVLYDACIRASLLRFHYPCCGSPYSMIYAGWICIARDRQIGKLYIMLTPVPNGTIVRLRFAYLDQVSVFRKKKQYSYSLDDKYYAKGFVDLIKHQIRLPVQ